MAVITATTIPVTSSSDLALEVGSPIHDVIIQHNNLMKQQAALALAFTSDGILRAIVPSTGTTNTLATSTGIITIAGVPVLVAAQTAQAMSASSALPAGMWTVVGLDAVANGTISMVYSSTIGTGQATKALAIADALTNVAKTANKARFGYIAVQAAAAATWTAGTDGFTLGSGGTVAQSTEFISMTGPYDLAAPSASATLLGAASFTAKQIGNMSGTALTV
jgi:hypothetical protein